MRITGFHVDGFGALHDTGVAGLGPGLTVVGGHNGAGKSSLHAFLVRALFGIPRSNAVDVARHFEPLRGGRQGGLVEAVDGAGAAWSVRRVKGGNPTLTVEGPAGASTTADALRPLLGELDRAGFERLFAIDLAGLQGTEDLPGEQLQSLLFDAATLGTSGSLRGARALAQERADELYLANGRVQPVAVTRRERAELEQELAAARAEVAGLADLREEAGRLEQERGGVAQEREQVERELALLGRVAQAWDRHEEARRLRAQALGLGDVTVDDEVRAGLARADEELAEVGARLADLDEEREGVSGRLDRLVADDRLHAAHDEVVRLHREAPVVRDRAERRASVRERVVTARRTADAAVADVGPGWDGPAVRAVATDGTTRSRVRTAAEALEEATAAHRGADERARTAAEELGRERGRLAERVEALGAAPDEASLTTVRGALATLGAQLPVLEQADVAAADRRRAARETGATPAVGGPPAWVGAVVAGLGLVLVAAGLVLGSAPLVAVAAVVLGVAGWLLGGRRGAAPAATPVALAPAPAPDAIDRARDAVAAAARVLGSDEVPDRARFAELAARVQADEERVAEHRRAAATLEEERGRVERLARDVARLEQAAAAAAVALDQARAAATAAATDAGLPADAVGEGPRALVALHDRVTEAAAALRAVDGAEAELEGLDGELAARREEVVRVLATAGRTVDDAQDAAAVLAVVHEAVAQDAATRRERERLVAELVTLDDQREQLADRRSEAEAWLSEACRRVGATDPEQLRELARAQDERARLEADAAEVEAEVDRLLGGGEAAERGRRLLAEGDVTGWDARQQQLRDRREELGDRSDELLAERTRLLERVAALVGDATIPELSLRLEMARERLDELVRRWAVLEAARRLLDVAVEHFESQQTPVVLREASRLLAGFTLGAWREVTQLDRVLYARREQGGELVPADQLSTGEQAQLYLALRVALADQQEVRLPLLLDDLLGSADDERADAIVRSLGELATERQVLLFTPSQRTTAAALAAVPGAGLLRLREGRVVEATPGEVR